MAATVGPHRGGIVGKRSRVGVLTGAVVALIVLCAGVARAITAPAGGASPSAATSATTTPTLPPTSAGPIRWHFEGRHSGIERYEPATTTCPVLDHHLHETFTLTNGTTWNFRAHYCGTIDRRGVWTGVGTFTIDTGKLSSISGTFTDSAQLPTVGIPYVIKITRGTGTFEGAHGRCVLDNHIRSLPDASQHQAGIFVCDFTR